VKADSECKVEDGPGAAIMSIWLYSGYASF